LDSTTPALWHTARRALDKGEIFGLVGESGSGKSTVANAVMGLLPRSAEVAGRIAVNGRETSALSEAEMRLLRAANPALGHARQPLAGGASGTACRRCLTSCDWKTCARPARSVAHPGHAASWWRSTM